YTTAQTVTITAVASDLGGVVRVKFFDLGTLKATVTAPPYTFAWSVTSADNGLHTWTAKAVDESGNSAVSLPVSLTVNIPTVSIDTTAPTGSLVINGGAASTNSPAVTVSLSATDTVGVTGYYLSRSEKPPAGSAAGW